MKTISTFALFLIFAFASLQGFSQPKDNPQKDIELIIKSSDGNNGMAVAWNPAKHLYYAAFGGNASYPLEVFTADGRNVYSEEIGFDIRGMVYHEKWNCLIGNCYDDAGYFRIYLSESGMPTGQKDYFITGMHQPDAQAGGTFNTKKGIMYCLNGMKIISYSLKNGNELKSLPITGFNEKELESCVSGSVLYTGKKGYEFILVNYLSNKLYFFNSKGAYVKMIYFSPEEYLHEMFNVSFCNNRLWTYNKDSRQWTSYMLF